MTVDVDSIKIKKDRKHKNVIKLDDNLSLKLKYPSMTQFIDSNFESKIDESEVKSTLDMIISCIDVIFSEEESWSASESTPKELEVVIVRPNIEIKTADSRKVVKKKVKIEKMTQQSANLGSFVSSLYSEDYDLMSRSVIDQVVEPDRAVLIPEFDKVKMISKDNGSIAAGISGSGPSIFSLSNNRVTSNNILDKISDHYNSMDIDFDVFISKVNSGGIKIIETK